MYPCYNADQGCKNLVAHPYDECETCFEAVSIGQEETVSEFTPGPWEVCPEGTDVYAPETDTSITNSGHPCYPDWDEAKANAQLIAAAPELLEVAKMLASLELADGGRTFPTKQMCAAARAAIAKSTGK